MRGLGRRLAIKARPFNFSFVEVPAERYLDSLAVGVPAVVVVARPNGAAFSFAVAPDHPWWQVSVGWLLLSHRQPTRARSRVQVSVTALLAVGFTPAGTPGSLIPAQWGNAVTDELLNVITTAGLVPDELLNNQLAAAIALIVSATRPLATQAEAEAGVDNAKSMTALRTHQAISKRAAIIGSSRNVRMSITSASTTATLTADEVFVKASLGGGLAWLIPAFNKTVNLATTGAGGMDIGAAPVSGYVSIYAIYNPTSGASALLACAQATSNGNIYSGINMPAGYTASALVSSWPTNASSQFIVGFQRDRTVSRAGVPVYTGSATSPSLATLSGAVPLNAVSCTGWMHYIGSSSPGGYIYLDADIQGTGRQVFGTSGTNVRGGGNFNIQLITPQTLYCYGVNITTSDATVTSYTF